MLYASLSRVTRIKIATSEASNTLHAHEGTGFISPQLNRPTRARTMPCTESTPSTTTASLMCSQP